MTAVSTHPEVDARRSRLSPRAHPRLSLVVTADVSRQWLDRLVTSIPRQLGPDVVEVLVVRAAGSRSEIDRTVRDSHLRHVTAPPGAGSAELRTNGLRQANGDLVLLIDSERPIEAGMVSRLVALSSTGEVPERDLRA